MIVGKLIIENETGIMNINEENRHEFIISNKDSISY